MTPKKRKDLTDSNLVGREAAESAIGKPIISLEGSVSEYLAEIGRKGGKEGGRARAKKLPAKKRSEIARKAARKRWGKDL